tara:strand:- start:51062 stop:51646 length:585 start_codon:yes stop_codon:yes gene_type:complete
MKYANPNKGENFRVLELGCGAGANIPFFRSLGAKYYAVEGSSAIVNHLKEVYVEYADNMIVGDFTVDLDFDLDFDLIIDRGSITHNSTSSIRTTLSRCKELMAPEGMMIGVDWFSTEFDEYKHGGSGEDKFTRTNFQAGRLNGIDLAHFCDHDHLNDLLQGFELFHLEHKTVNQLKPEGRGFYAAWNFVAALAK